MFGVVVIFCSTIPPRVPHVRRFSLIHMFPWSPSAGCHRPYVIDSSSAQMECFDGNNAWTWLCQEVSLTSSKDLNFGCVGLGKCWILWIWLYLIGNKCWDLVAHVWFSPLQTTNRYAFVGCDYRLPRGIWIR